MRYALMATYRGVPYEAGVGPTDADIVLFTFSPPRDDPGFEPGAGYWRKRVSRDEIDELWESRPVGRYRSEPCLVLEEIGDRLHITHLGHDAYQAERLGYWQVDRGVYEVVVPREEVTDLVEERVDFHIRRAPVPPPTVPPPMFTPGPEAAPASNGARRDGGTSYSALGNWDAGSWDGAGRDGGNWDGASALGPVANHVPSSNGTGHAGSQPGTHGSWPGAGAHRSGSSVADALAGRRAREAERPNEPTQQPATTPPNTPPLGIPPGAAAPTVPAPPASPPANAAPPPSPAHAAPAHAAPAQSPPAPSPAPVTPDLPPAVPPPTPPATVSPAAATPPTALPRRGDAPSPPGGRRRRTRVETRWVFKDLIDMAAIPQASYAVDEEIDGALCLIKTDDGYEVFSATDGAKHEVRFFDDEESAYFYLFGVLAAEAVRSGRLVPPAPGS